MVGRSIGTILLQVSQLVIGQMSIIVLTVVILRSCFFIIKRSVMMLNVVRLSVVAPIMTKN
jgi:hypothetical protein